jgi:hypothetical protein
MIRSDEMQNNQRDDRLIPLARIAFGFLAVLSIIYGPLLYLYPGGTARYWAWEVQPEMSAVWLGAGYILAAIFLSTILFLGRVQKLFVALLTVWSFSCAMLFATLIHIDRFFVDRLAFWAWFFIYLIVPIAVPAFWLLNKKHAIPHQEGELQFPKNSAYLGAFIGFGLFLLAAMLIFNPAVAASFWPWNLTPLMSRVIGGWILALAAAALSLVFERRYLSYREFIPEAGVWLVLILIGGWRYSEQFDFSRPSTYIFFGGLSLLALSMFYLFFSWESRYRKMHSESEGRTSAIEP